MAQPSVTLLRDWSPNPPSGNNKADDSDYTQPVIATLVANLSEQFEKFSFLASNQNIVSIPSYPSVPSWVLDDTPDHGELHVMGNGSLQLSPSHDDYDEQYEQAFQKHQQSKSRCNSNKPFSKLRKLIGRGPKRNRDNKGKKQNASPTFPIQIQQGEDRNTSRRSLRSRRSETSIPLATPCLNLNRQQNSKNTVSNAPGKHNISAPRKQNMSRAARDLMNEPKIIPDHEISELNSNPEDSMSLQYSLSDTEACQTPPRAHFVRSRPKFTNKANHKSFDDLIRETKFVLEDSTYDREVCHIKYKESPTRSIVDQITSTKSKSLPNIFSDLPPSPPCKQAKPNCTGKTVFSHQLQVPESPRRLHRDDKSIQKTIKSPPRYAFKKSNELVSCDRFLDQYNNTLKVVFIGSPGSAKSNLISALTKKCMESTKRDYEKNSSKSVYVNVDTWNPTGRNDDRNITFNLFDIKGGSLDDGVHPSTQSLFFSSNSLYVLVWDLASCNVSDIGLRSRTYSIDSCESDYEEELRKEQMDQQIARDIDKQMMYWVNLLSNSELSNYAILPVVTFDEQFEPEEVQHRCDMLMQRLTTISRTNNGPHFAFALNGSIPMISSITHAGVVELEQCILNLVNRNDTIFHRHFETTITAVTKSVQNLLIEFRKKGFNVVSYEQISVKLAENPPSVESLTQSLVLEALLLLSSTGNIIYFGSSKNTCTRPHYLEDFVILSPRWLSTALSLALRKNPDFSMTKTGKKNVKFDDDMGVSKFRQSLPLVSLDESIKLWERIDCIRNSNHKISEPGSNSENDLYYFLQQVCEHSGVFVPFTIGDKKKEKSYYLIPIFAESEPPGFWSYHAKDEWITSLCNSFTFNDSITSNFIDKVIVSVLKIIHSFQDVSESRTMRQILYYWKTAIYVKVIEVFEDADGRRLSHTTEFFVQWIESNKKLNVSAKGYDGNCGDKIWRMGYGSILESIERLANVYMDTSSKREIFCPDCLLKTNFHYAKVWDCNDLIHSDEAMKCLNGHEVSAKLLLGPYDDIDDGASVATGANSIYSNYSNYSRMSAYSGCTDVSCIKADKMMPAVVIVALWDKSSNQLVRIGSGFIADKKRGLIVTASHILFNLENDNDGRFGQMFYGLPNATALIGVNNNGLDSAVFTYCADVITSDVHNVDGCVLQIKSKFEKPVELDRNRLTPRPEIPISTKYQFKQEQLQHLRGITTETPREQGVRVLGYRQTGDGLIEGGGKINRIACVNAGFICKPRNSHHNHSDRDEFIPRSEIVVSCPTEGGNSGGPFVNDQGEVIGILSRVNPTETDRCYLTASVELIKLLNKAKDQFDQRSKNIFSSSRSFEPKIDF